jgi:hypothetical protein
MQLDPAKPALHFLHSEFDSQLSQFDMHDEQFAPKNPVMQVTHVAGSEHSVHFELLHVI